MFSFISLGGVCFTDIMCFEFPVVKVHYSHCIGHLLSGYRRINDCLYRIVYGQAAVMHHIGPHSGPLCTITARIVHYNLAYLPLEPVVLLHNSLNRRNLKGGVGMEPRTFWLQRLCSNHYTTEVHGKPALLINI